MIAKVEFHKQNISNISYWDFSLFETFRYTVNQTANSLHVWRCSFAGADTIQKCN